MGKHVVCSVDDLPIGSMNSFKAGAIRVVVYHLDKGFFATQALCTHTLGPLARGEIVEGCQVQCPLHRARFDIATGAVVRWASFPPGIQLLNVVRGAKTLRTFPVAIRNGKVEVTA
ncbi:MAG: non-heme iron oxygenase ferredoxin subunit [Gammaproteobacteria bacterium]|nr:non-heme iron oxygenase ferredoxin subunit [Gammaproteobacteria bacterium]